MLAYINLENDTWTKETGPSINPVTADNYNIVQGNGALSLIMCSSKPYSGWLAKNVQALPFAAKNFVFSYTVMIDDATLACAQVIETDSKITDADGWTYDCSLQFNLAKGWMIQVGDPWVDTGIQVVGFPSYEKIPVSIESSVDYANHQSIITRITVDGSAFPVPTTLMQCAKQESWAPSQIVTQLQQVNNSQPGGYTLRFCDISQGFIA